MAGGRRAGPGLCDSDALGLCDSDSDALGLCDSDSGGPRPVRLGRTGRALQGSNATSDPLIWV